MSDDRANPPSVWAGATQLTEDIYWLGTDNGNPLVWHWCPTDKRWAGWETPDHTLVSTAPLHLEASLLFPCCGLHGFIRAGKWVTA